MDVIQHRFQVIEGGKQAKHVSSEDDAASRLECKVCEFHEGVSSTEFLAVHPAVFVKGNSVHSIMTRYLCLCCHYKGRKTYLT